MEKPDLKNYSLAKLTETLAAMGMPAYRAKQVFAWIYRPGLPTFARMTDLSLPMRGELEEQYQISWLEPAKKELSEDGTCKYAFRLADGNVVESVLIPEEDRNTLCLSSQVGCAMGCRFCLTATMGFVRNLTAAEMVNQVCTVAEELRAKEQVVTNLVFMGMGEPLANFEQLVTAIDILTDNHGLAFSSRRVTVSTCGLIPRIVELGEKTRVNLAVSLHAADDEKRDQLMPVNRTYPISELLATLRDFPLPPRRRIMIEYIMIKGVNDADADAELLARKLHGISCKINLLPYNETSSLGYEPSPMERIERFREILRNHGYTALLRTSRGADISAACGQLAAKER
jgi:23S rRNA (adenine2503-C2)-methyltransferase